MSAASQPLNGSLAAPERHTRERLAFSKQEAADALGVSVDFFEQHVMPDLRVVRRGRRVLIARAELDRWLDVSAAVTLDRQAR